MPYWIRVKLGKVEDHTCENIFLVYKKKKKKKTNTIILQFQDERSLATKLVVVLDYNLTQ